MLPGMPASSETALRGLARIVDLPVRVGAVARRAERNPEAFVAALESLVVESGLGSTAAADAVLACALWLLEQDDAYLSKLHAIAVREGHALVSAMLADAAPHRGLAPGGRLLALDIPSTARVVRRLFVQSGGYHYYLIDGVRYESWSGGDAPVDPSPKLATWEEYASHFEELLERCRAAPFAWRPMHPASVRSAVTRLGQHHSPFTVGRLLDDPSVREADVIAVAARRPTTPAIVRSITSRSRWIRLPNVRAALLANPCTPTRVALLLAATCLPRLPGIVAAGNVHPRVRELARLVRARSENRAAPSAG